MCKKIHRGGNAEQYHADKKYKEAVAVAVEACADDNMKRPSEQPTTTRCPLMVYSASKKPSLCCTKQYPWRDAFSKRVIDSRSR